MVAAMMEFDPIAANEPLLREITRFCDEQGMSPTAFGEAALNDRALVGGLRKGRQLLPGTMHRLRVFMKETQFIEQPNEAGAA